MAVMSMSVEICHVSLPLFMCPAGIGPDTETGAKWARDIIPDPPAS